MDIDPGGPMATRAFVMQQPMRGAKVEAFAVGDCNAPLGAFCMI